MFLLGLFLSRIRNIRVRAAGDTSEILDPRPSARKDRKQSLPPTRRGAQSCKSGTSPAESESFRIVLRIHTVGYRIPENGQDVFAAKSCGERNAASGEVPEL